MTSPDRATARLERAPDGLWCLHLVGFTFERLQHACQAIVHGAELDGACVTIAGRRRGPGQAVIYRIRPEHLPRLRELLAASAPTAH